MKRLTWVPAVKFLLVFATVLTIIEQGTWIVVPNFVHKAMREYASDHDALWANYWLFMWCFFIAPFMLPAVLLSTQWLANRWFPGIDPVLTGLVAGSNVLSAIAHWVRPLNSPVFGYIDLALAFITVAATMREWRVRVALPEFDHEGPVMALVFMIVVVYLAALLADAIFFEIY